MEDRRKLRIILLLLSFLIVVGTIGYMLLLETSLINALYMTVITISTVGYKEVGIMSPAAKLFSIFLIFFGVGTVAYTFSTVLVMFIDGKIQDIWRNRKMEAKIQSLSDHYILCGAGESGMAIIQDFIRHSASFVVVEEDEERCAKLSEMDVLFICGDATDEAVLRKARIESAKGLLACISTDMENVMVVLAARELNPELYIISRAIASGSHNKLTKVGANKTVSINEIGGKRMAGMIMRPHIISFLDVITRVGNVQLDLEEVTVSPDSSLAGKTLREAAIPQKTGLIVLAVNEHQEKKLLFNPSGDFKIRAGDILIVMGTEEQVDSLLSLVKADN
ncbi:MAG: potassium channel protein [Eubacteriales bacterium]|nr:potassium channel protein [Eubacteriales bacterium]